jgi:ubiquinone/menaquinone biosynthesis C-methylase UbiE
MDVSDNFFDYTFCWQTLSWLDNPKKALLELVRITKPNGRLYLSSLFNMDFDVDIYRKVFDYTRKSGQHGIPMDYNTYSLYSVKKWLNDKVTSFKIHPFVISIDLPVAGRGVGTFTKVLADTDERIQISGGILMTHGILEILK